MKLTIVLLIACFFQVSATVYAQNSKYSLDIKDKQVEQVLREIEETSNVHFFYQRDQINLDRKVSIKVSESTIEDILDQLFEGQGIAYEFKENNLVLLRSIDANLNRNGISQQKNISGKVVDTNSQPLPGVSIVIKGTTVGTTTDSDGNFSLTNVSEDATLVFSFIGMKTLEFAVGGQSNFNIVMEDDAIGIDEVVAIGYGTIKKQAVTGAVAQANLEPYEDVAANNILERIKGSIAGVNISGVNRAGEVANIVIRGQNSTAASNAPLIVLDGAIFAGSLADIAPNDIEDLTVLKDASAAAVYGSRSSNGVIIIETKRGTGIKGKPKFDVNVNYGISEQLERLKLYDAEGYLQRMLHDRQLLIPDATFEDDVEPFFGGELLKNYTATPDHQPTLTDPYDLTDRMGHVINTTFSISNRLEKLNYYISTTLGKQRGIIINDDFKHISGRVNISSDLTDWLTVGINSFYSRKDYSGSSPEFWRTTAIGPYASIFNDDGSYKIYPNNWVGIINPLSSIAVEDLDIQNYLSSVINGRIRVPWVEGLTYNVTYSNSTRWNKRYEFFDEKSEPGFSVNGKGEREYNGLNNSLLDNMITYDRTFLNKHNLNVTLLYSWEKTVTDNTFATSRDFANTILGTYKMESGAIQTIDTDGGETQGIGMMARATYSYMNKYSLTGTIRRDGFSAFSKNKKWGNFPSVALRWNIGEENFMDDINFLDYLSLRASYGTNGNQSIDPYASLATIATSEYQFFGPTSHTLTQFIDRLANDDLGWESTTGLNVGIEFSVLKNRISGTIDAYRTRTNDLMFTLAMPAISGKEEILSNIGEIQNKGIELNLQTVNIEKGNFKWSSDFAFTLNRNKVVTILGEDNDGDGIEDDLTSAKFFIGRSLGTVYDYKILGMWQQEDLDNGTILSGFRPGDYKLEDIDGDGSITSDKDRQFLGDKKESFRWSWTNILEYKDFSLMAYFYSIWGGNGRYLSEKNTPYLDFTALNSLSNHPVYDYWRADNTDAMFPRFDYGDKAQVKAINYIDRSFIKLQKVALSYNASKLVSDWGINDLKITLSGDNLFTHAPDWLGLDPETDSGLTFNSEPSIRTYYLSVAFNF